MTYEKAQYFRIDLRLHSGVSNRRSLVDLASN